MLYIVIWLYHCWAKASSSAWQVRRIQVFWGFFVMGQTWKRTTNLPLAISRPQLNLEFTPTAIISSTNVSHLLPVEDTYTPNDVLNFHQASNYGVTESDHKCYTIDTQSSLWPGSLSFCERPCIGTVNQSIIYIITKPLPGLEYVCNQKVSIPTEY